MTAIVKASQMRVGDVLLYRGRSLFSSLIMAFDGGEYSHSAIYNGQEVVEAVGEGVVHRGIAVSVAGADYVDVFRFRSATNVTLGDPRLPADPVHDRIKHFSDNAAQYAYEQILLLALLVTTRRIPVAGIIIRPILDHAADLLNRLMDLGREPMICSELVYRCFAEAGPQYLPQIVGAAAMRASAVLDEAVTPATGGDELTAVQSEAFLRTYLLAKEHYLTEAASGAAGFAPVADFVTPRDLQFCPNLVKIGRLSV